MTVTTLDDHRTAPRSHRTRADKPRRPLTAVERFANIRSQYPTTTWDAHQLLEDDQVFGKLLVDICKVGWSPSQRRGNRPELDYSEFVSRLRALGAMRRGEFTTLPFADALLVLIGERSLRHVQAKTGIPKTQIGRLLAGEHLPTSGEMEAVAAAFDKAPTFFVEYRTAAILATIAEQLERSPEVSAGLVQQLALDRQVPRAS